MQVEAFPLEDVTRRPQGEAETPALRVSAEWAAGVFDACGTFYVVDDELRVDVGPIPRAVLELLLRTYKGCVWYGRHDLTWYAHGEVAEFFSAELEDLSIAKQEMVSLACTWGRIRRLPDAGESPETIPALRAIAARLNNRASRSD